MAHFLSCDSILLVSVKVAFDLKSRIFPSSSFSYFFTFDSHNFYQYQSIFDECSGSLTEVN